jgi:hypothetical protein
MLITPSTPTDHGTHSAAPMAARPAEGSADETTQPDVVRKQSQRPRWALFAIVMLLAAGAIGWPLTAHFRTGLPVMRGAQETTE